MAGICLIVGVQAFDRCSAQQLLAEIAIVAATLCYAGGAIFSRGFKGLDPMAPAAGSLALRRGDPDPGSLARRAAVDAAPSTSSVLALLGLAVFSTAAAFVIYFRLIQTLGSVGTTAQAYLRVPIGVALGVMFLGESLSPTAWIGLACVVVGVAAMTIPPRRRRIAESRVTRRPCRAAAIVGILPANPDASKAPQNRSGQGRAMSRALVCASLVACAGGRSVASAHSRCTGDFPNRPIRIVIPYSAGSVADVFGRIVAQNMAAQWNGSIIMRIQIRRQRLDRRRGSRARHARWIYVAAGDGLLHRQPVALQ